MLAPMSDPKPPAPPPALDQRRLQLADLIPHRDAFVAADLVALLGDGRALVRANAALALAAAGHGAPALLRLLRDSDAQAAAAAATAVAALGPLLRSCLDGIAGALDGASAGVVDTVVTALAGLLGSAERELIAALDVPLELAERTVLAAAAQAGPAGVTFLVRASAAERSRVRINAVAGLGQIGKVAPEPALACLGELERADPVPDVRTAAKQAILRVVAREREVVVDRLPTGIADFEARKLTSGELRAQVAGVVVEEMMFALRDGRDHVRVNAARALAVKGAAAAAAAVELGLVLRDSVAQVRREVALALGKLGPGAVAAADALVGALGDGEDEVAEAATAALTGLGPAARPALIRGLDTGGERHGERVATLLAALPGAAEVLCEAFTSPAVNTQVNAAFGLGLLGDRVGPGLDALHGARTGGDPRTRVAVRRALDVLEASVAAGPQVVEVAGFEARVLAPAELEAHKAALERVGPADLIAHLADGRDVVRANAASALALVATAAPALAGAAQALGLRLRDDAVVVRMAAAAALDRLGDDAVLAAADDLVGALGDRDDAVAARVEAALTGAPGPAAAGRPARLIGPLLRGLHTERPAHGARVGALLARSEDAVELLVDALASPAVAVQVNAALALGQLGARVGAGRRALEQRRTGGDARTREAVRQALATLDGPRAAGPRAVAVDGFETRVLTAAELAGPGLVAADLGAHLVDGRAVVRANAATALGTLGEAALPASGSLAVLLRDDDGRVRIAAASALAAIGPAAVRAGADALVGALRGDAEVAAAATRVLAPVADQVISALLRGLETDDEVHAQRLLAVIARLDDAADLLADAFSSAAENVQVNAALGLGLLGRARAGAAAIKLLEGARTRGFARTRAAVFKALAALRP